MIEKQEFTLFDPKPEEDYLNQKAKDGYHLVDVNEEGYHFKESDPLDSYYLVEYYEDPESVDVELYHNQGFELVTQFFTKKGVWLYFVGQNIEEPIQRVMVDRDRLIEKSFRRVELFSMTIAGSLVILAIFMIIRYQHPAFYLLLVMAIGFLYYVFTIYLKLKRLRKPEYINRTKE